MRSSRAFLAALVVNAVAACAGPAAEPPTSAAVDGVLAADSARVTSSGAPVDEAVDGMQQLGAELYAAAAADPTENVVLSPASIALAFGMARAGARGETAAQLDEVLHLPPEVHAAFNAVEQAVVTSEDPPPRPTATRDAQQQLEPQPPVVSIANALFAQDGLEVEPAFLHVLAQQYGAGVRVVDFTDQAAAKATIDAWVRQQTAEKIQSLFDQLPTSTALVLANAVYLKADWRTPFDAPRLAEFTSADGSVARVPTMQATEPFRYAEGEGWQAVEVPYAGDELAMWVLVPEPGSAPGRLLDPAVLETVEAGLREAQVELHLPLWDMATDLDLRALLQDLGLTLPFSPGADFTAMGPGGTRIEQAVHRATISVDEWGTEAAAVTGLVFPTSGPPPVEAVVRADHPFAFVVRHTPTGTPLFLGHVADPAARG